MLPLGVDLKHHTLILASRYWDTLSLDAASILFSLRATLDSWIRMHRLILYGLRICRAHQLSTCQT